MKKSLIALAALCAAAACFAVSAASLSSDGFPVAQTKQTDRASVATLHVSSEARAAFYSADFAPGEAIAQRVSVAFLAPETLGRKPQRADVEPMDGVRNVQPTRTPMRE